MTRAMIAVLGIDLGKSSCSLVGLDAEGAVVLRKRMRRETAIFGKSGEASISASGRSMPSLSPGRGRIRRRDD